MVANFFLLFFVLFYSANGQERQLTPDEISSISTQNDAKHFNTVLDEIIQPRIPGTQQHEVVKDFIVGELQSLNFDLELDSFSKNVPIFRNVTFTNIVGRLNPNAEKYLTLACHYDSKYFAQGTFYGAIDSAVPCAIILNTLYTLRGQLNNLRSKTDLSLMVIFFDGEEAYKTWTENDSLYGSRHLADKWHSTRSSLRNTRKIDEIDVMILLDLIGSKDPVFRSFYEDTKILHDRLAEIERFVYPSSIVSRPKYMFSLQRNYNLVDDDHRPFLQKNVPILHIIPTPFPSVWHELSDTKENLHMPTINKFLKVFRLFVVDYLKTLGNS